MSRRGSILLSLQVIVINFVLIYGSPGHQKDGPTERELWRAVESFDANKTADLNPLINETLTINNKSLGSDKIPNIRDDWTFDMVEYDLMDFLQNLSARYKLSNGSQSVDNGFEALLDSKSDQPGKSIAANKDNETIVLTKLSPGHLSAPVNKPPSHGPPLQDSTPAPELSTSIASGDQEIAEQSSWQYGIFDRFTRPRGGVTTPTPPEPMSGDEIRKLGVREFNSDECGLRTYEESTQYFPPAPEGDTSAEAIKELNIRRQKPTNLNQKFGSGFGSLSDLLLGPASSSNTQNPKRNDQSIISEFEKTSELDQTSPEGDFNLLARRQWLQQQLGNTLQMLGFNSTSLAAIDSMVEGSTGLRENMMKMSAHKIGKSIGQSLENNGTDDQARNFKARQDDLKLEARVIGGNDARLGDSPWSVSLQALVTRPGTGGIEYRHYCGGTIISEWYILTAAHCLDFMVGRESRLFVVIGDLNWRMNAASLYGRRFGVEKLIIHGSYKNTAFGHDIGLIKTKERMRPVKVNGHYIVNSVCLPERGVEHGGDAELVGWGLFSNRNEMADTLQIADVPILPRPLCVDLYRRRTGLIQWLIGIELITDKQVCAGTFGRGICQGDSGSALVHNSKQVHATSQRRARQEGRSQANRREQAKTRATIIGTVAFGGIRRCSYQSLPGVYMQTSKYLDWILPRIIN